MHPKINFLSLIPSLQHNSMKTNLNNNVIHFHGCKVKAPKVKFYASFKCFFHYFKSSAEAILLKEPSPAVKQHFLQICPDFISSSVIYTFGDEFSRFKIILYPTSNNSAARPHVCNLQVTSNTYIQSYKTNEKFSKLLILLFFQGVEF